MGESMKSAKLDAERYGRLLTEAAPRVIRNDNDLDRFTALLLGLDEKLRPTAEERELAELLTLLIEQYEERRHAIPKARPVEVLRFLLEEHGLSAKDLWPLIGSKGVTSEILNGKRNISLAAAAKLADRFHVSPTVFVDWDLAKRAQAS